MAKRQPKPKQTVADWEFPVVFGRGPRVHMYLNTERGEGQQIYKIRSVYMADGERQETSGFRSSELIPLLKVVIASIRHAGVADESVAPVLAAYAAAEKSEIAAQIKALQAAAKQLESL